MMEIEYLKTDKDLFSFAEEIYRSYFHDATLSNFLLLTFVLNHLREWVVNGQKWEDIEKVNYIKRTPEQRFFSDIWNLDTFKIIKDICNGVKHCIAMQQLTEIKGARAGLLCAGDRLGQNYILIDGKDSRAIFSEVLLKYRDWFNKKC
jgi:hypothetical protein